MQRKFLIGLCTASLLGGCALFGSNPAATAKLEARSGSQVAGSIGISEIPGGLRLMADVSGLTPGAHGFHVHESGDCSAPDASSAKGHYNPGSKPHGHHAGMNRHMGDMPNLIADGDGKVRVSMDILGLKLADIVGRSIVIHADPDDYQSQPAGNSGKRVACGTIAGK